MAITTYAELQTAVANWLDRSDLTARIPEFIALAEGRFRRELREWLRSSISATAVTDDYVVAATVEAVLGVAYDDGAGGTYNHPLDLITWDDYHARMGCSAEVRAPVTACYVDRDESGNTTTLRFYPPVSAASPIDALTINVVGYLPALSVSATSNRLLTVAPDVYLYGSLVEAGEYLQHDERVPRWESRASQAIAALRMQTDRKLYGGVPRPRALPVVLG